MPVISRLVKILIVDDHGLVREGLQAILSRSELLAECVQAWDAASLWQQLEQHADIDLVLMDIQLPDVSGLSLLEELTQRLPQLPVIMLSADHDAGIVLHSLEQGARGFLPKSSLNQVLVSAIRLVAAGGVYVPPEALQKPAARPAAAGPQAPVSIASLGFTARQTDVFRLLLQGLSNKQICRELDLAEPTVKIHVRGILRTLGVSSRAEVIAKYGMLSPSPSTPRQAAAADH
ncbi:MAG: DNA-binding response regulator [Acidovorax sp.]|jgi:DNA-binding NarL/FixJ family response regulator|nr:two component transcriptional regulator, LuxR family [Acidovorax sp. JS42]MBP7325576.1 response regulator transcription factor [Alicycliphilus sp.]PZU40529.1 MAG: DNA-binding response regulator [Acidovorax sp.]